VYALRGAHVKHGHAQMVAVGTIIADRPRTEPYERHYRIPVPLENPRYIKLASTWIILNSGGGPTPDKPEVLLETPSDLNRVNSFLNLPVADIWACYKQWLDKAAFFLTEPLDNHGCEWRC
jgi:hypothetical protein